MKAFLLLLLVLLVLLPGASLSPLRSGQALLEILGEDLEALLSGPHGDPPLLSQDSLSRLLTKPRPSLRDTPSPPSASPPEEAWIHLLRHHLLNTQKHFRGRTKKKMMMMMMGQQGCFGIKLDRIGTLSGLGC